MRLALQVDMHAVQSHGCMQVRAGLMQHDKHERSFCHGMRRTSLRGRHACSLLVHVLACLQSLQDEDNATLCDHMKGVRAHDSFVAPDETIE